MDISTLADGLFRIYSWDTWTGGSMHAFENVLQYKSPGKMTSMIDRPNEEGDFIHNYNQVYTLFDNGKAYYLADYLDIASTKDVSNGIHYSLWRTGN